MKLQHIPLDQLQRSALNVRRTGGKDVDDLTASIRSLGLLQPLLVREAAQGFDIVAGQRRHAALVALAAENGESDPVPCIVMDGGDDALVIEASLAENIARLPMDEVDQYKAFAALRKEGLPTAEIAARFGVTERLVEQRLAIAAIIAPVLNAFRRGDIGSDTLRALTMATPRQQKAWWTLFRSEDQYAPTGHALKRWLFGGAQIPVSNALFDLATYEGAIVSDLFGEERYFADTDAFWTLQTLAVEEAKQGYLAAGWGEVVTLEVGAGFYAWSHVKTPRKRGGKVFIAITADGEVSVHEGWLDEKEARRRAKADAGTELAEAEGARPSERSELTAVMRNYLGLHRHAAVRAELLGNQSLALRLAVAHIIAGSSLWKVEAEPQRADSDAIAGSLAASKAQAAFAEERRHVLALLGSNGGEEGRSTVASRRHDFCDRADIEDVMRTLIALDEAGVLRVLTFVMAETLEAHSAVVESLGTDLRTDTRNWWEPESLFFDLLRDKRAIKAMLAEVAGPNTAEAHEASTAKVQKKIIADCLSGDGRAKVEGWLPRYMAFPAGSYLDQAEETGSASAHHETGGLTTIAPLDLDRAARTSRY